LWVKAALSALTYFPLFKVFEAVYYSRSPAILLFEAAHYLRSPEFLLFALLLAIFY
jgi:hypothetical protein